MPQSGSFCQGQPSEGHASAGVPSRLLLRPQSPSAAQVRILLLTEAQKRLQGDLCCGASAAVCKASAVHPCYRTVEKFYMGHSK